MIVPIQLLAVFLFLCVTVQAQNVSVDERTIRGRLVDGRTSVSIPVENPSPNPARLSLTAEWLDASGTPRALIERIHVAPPGRSVWDSALSLPQGTNPLELRLRYRLGPANDQGLFGHVSTGVVSFAHLADHAFFLTGTVAGTPRHDEPYEILIRAAHPITHQPFAGIRLEAKGQQALTGEDGTARLLVPSPAGTEHRESVEVRARMGDVFAATEVSLPARGGPRLRIQTDKPLYHPGQTAHIRIWSADSDGRPSDGRPFDVEISGDVDLLKTRLRTSRFGIASVDWQIPKGAVSGTYRVNVSGEEPSHSGSQRIEVRPREPWHFVIKAKPVRSYFLPGQTPAVEVEVQRKSGKRAVGAEVRIESGWGVKRRTVVSGAVGPTGLFRSALPAPAKFFQSDERYRDITYYVTISEPGSGYSGRQKFQLRYSREPVHVYQIRSEKYWDGIRVYAATYTPDGNPAACEVQLLSGGKVIASGRSNRYGAVKLHSATTDSDFTLRAFPPDAKAPAG
ncbi:MAG: hypothetical protein JNL98_37830, partial [Bryobacterales bacterium]|nr:hypothetical protein [Bryobacterales bacterium]